MISPDIFVFTEYTLAEHQPFYILFQGLLSVQLREKMRSHQCNCILRIYLTGLLPCLGGSKSSVCLYSSVLHLLLLKRQVVIIKDNFFAQARARGCFLCFVFVSFPHIYNKLFV